MSLNNKNIKEKHLNKKNILIIFSGLFFNYLWIKTVVRYPFFTPCIDLFLCFRSDPLIAERKKCIAISKKVCYKNNLCELCVLLAQQPATLVSFKLHQNAGPEIYKFGQTFLCFRYHAG